MKKHLGSILDIIIIITSLFTMISYGQHKEYIYEQNIIYTRKLQEQVRILEENKHKLREYREYYNNNDIVGSLKIEGTKIDTLLVKGKDNDYYLNRGVDGKYNTVGTIYVDYRTPLDSKQINIYGHNSWYYDIPFRDLENYLKEDFYKEHKYINLWTGKVDTIYEIFSVQIVTTDYEHMIVEPKDMKEHIEKLSKSIYETGVEVTENDSILVLQTCNFNPKDTFIVIYAKKI